MEYINAILDNYVARFNELWPNGISEEERLDLESLGRKEAEINQQVRQDYYQQKRVKEE